MEKQMKGYVKTKISNIFFKIRKADFLNEAGKYSESREILEELIPYEYMMNNAILTSYYKVWINYFLEYFHFLLSLWLLNSFPLQYFYMNKDIHSLYNQYL